MKLEYLNPVSWDTRSAGTMHVWQQRPLLGSPFVHPWLAGVVTCADPFLVLCQGFSKKDRIAKEMIEEAERLGELGPNQPVIELTSGNTGTGLAIVCAATRHPFIAVMSKGNSIERARMMRALGAEVLLVDQLGGSVVGQVSGGDLDLVRKETERIASVTVLPLA